MVVGDIPSNGILTCGRTWGYDLFQECQEVQFAQEKLRMDKETQSQKGLNEWIIDHKRLGTFEVF